MTHAYSTSSSMTSEDRRRKLAAYSAQKARADAIAEIGDAKDRERMALQLLIRGRSREDVADFLSMDVKEVALLEESYFSSSARLSETAMFQKQLMRLEMLLDRAFDIVMDMDAEGHNVASTLAVIKEISELAGLKKTRVEAQVKVIEERQVPLIVNFTQNVVNDMMGHIAPHLTDTGAQLLEAKKEAWLIEASHKAAEDLTPETVTVTM